MHPLHVSTFLNAPQEKVLYARTSNYAAKGLPSLGYVNSLPSNTIQNHLKTVLSSLFPFKTEVIMYGSLVWPRFAPFYIIHKRIQYKH